MKGNIHVVYMASTRNRNSDGEYKNWQAAQSTFSVRETHVTADMYSKNRAFLPGNSLIHGKVPGVCLAHNSVDIESSLRGIRANDMVNGAPNVTPNVKKQQFMDVASRTRIPLITPAPLTYEPNQRALYMN